MACKGGFKSAMFAGDHCRAE